MDIKKYSSIPFEVEGVQVTDANFYEVLAWCGGEKRTALNETKELVNYIKVKVKNPKYPRQENAFVGDYVLRSPKGFKVYTASGFANSFCIVNVNPVEPTTTNCE